jgi:hypothetical protein
MASEPSSITGRGPHPPVEEMPKPKRQPKKRGAPKAALGVAKGQHPPQEE